MTPCCHEPHITIACEADLESGAAGELGDVFCTTCGGCFTANKEITELRVKAEAMDKVLSLLPDHEIRPENPHVSFKSVPDYRGVQDVAVFTVESVARLFRAEIEHSPPELRNRFTVQMFFGDDVWNLTLARGDYEHAVEKQRNEARKERDHWMKRYFDEHPDQTPPTNNDNEQDGA